MATSPATNLENTGKNILFDYQTNYEIKAGAPRLVPKSQGANTGSSADEKNGIVDVVNSFSWTTLPTVARANVPQVELREYRLTSSTLIQSAIQQARSYVDAIGGFSSNLFQDIAKGFTLAGFNIPDEELKRYLETIYDDAQKDYLNPYKHLYPAKPTGWIYNFPYFDAGNQSISNNWSDRSGDDTAAAVKEIMTVGVPGKLINALQAAGRTAPIFNITQPGSYTETIKNFVPAEGGGIQVKFPLLNTLKYEDIQKNWELCFLLTYQNLPNRRSVSLLDPPVIYSATIPGVRRFLFAYMTDLQITNIGAMRYVDLEIGRKLIPEAYSISFNLKDLLVQTQNLHLYANEGNVVEGSVS